MTNWRRTKIGRRFRLELLRFRVEVGLPFRPVHSELYNEKEAPELIRDPSLCDCPDGPASENCIHMYHGTFIAPVRRLV